MPREVDSRSQASKRTSIGRYIVALKGLMVLAQRAHVLPKKTELESEIITLKHSRITKNVTPRAAADTHLAFLIYVCV